MSHTSASYAPAGSATSGAGSSKALQLVARTFAWVAEQRRIKRTVATLSSLSDATLKDIGIERGNIEHFARQGRQA
jgi:uncharacterized protein YjiS (DUF1127 family)